ncbi:MAG: hypothetical protein ABTQ32_33300 [Myxococcaceae bacterium]
MASVDGVVLCVVSGARLAVSADQVDAIAPAEGPVWDAGVAFGETSSPSGRALQCLGRLIRFDTIDVVATTGLEVLPVPAALVNTAHGALTGFVELSGALWPLVALDRLLAYLEARAR